MRKEICGKCKFFDLSDHKCHAGPPKVVYKQASFKDLSLFPTVGYYEWCGCFKKKGEVSE